MDIRYSLVTEYDESRELEGIAEELRTRIDLVRQAEFDGISVSEHHVTEVPYLNNEAVLGRLSGLMGEKTIQMGICLLPYHNPVRIAEYGATLDILSGGNFHLSVGQGYRTEEFAVFGIDRASAVGRLEEGIEVIERLWSEDNVTYDGEFFSFEDVTINPKPLQKPRPKITMAASNESSVRRAARITDGWYAAHIPFDVLSKYVEAFQEEREQARNDLGDLSIAREVFVAETTEEADRIAKEPLLGKYNTYNDWGQSDVFEDDEFESNWDRLKSERFIVGSPDDVRREIEQYRDTFDPDALVIRTAFPGINAADVRSSIELLGEEVLPTLN